MSEKNNYKLVIITVIAVTVGSTVGSHMVNIFLPTGLNGDDQLIKVAEEVNKTLPLMIDSQTRLNSTFGLNNTFTYNYTLVNYTHSELDIDIFKSKMEIQLKNNYCTSEDMKYFLKKETQVNFSYFDKEGKQITKLSYNPKDCNS